MTTVSHGHQSSKADPPEASPAPQGPGASQTGEYSLPASFAQRRLWSIEQAESTGGAYNVPFGLRFRGDLDPDALARAFQFLEDRHEILRTSLVLEEGELHQIVRAPAAFPLRRESLESAGGAVEAVLATRRAAEQTVPFDLARGPLIRATLFRLGPLDHALTVTMHHAIVDVWSIDIFLRELAASYNAIRGGTAPALAPLPIQYADYAAWQIAGQSGAEMSEKLEQWKRALSPPLPALELPTDHPRPAARAWAGSRVRFPIGPGIAGPLRRLAQESNATMFMALLASFQVLLHRHTGQDDVIVGTPITGRTLPETANQIGFFLNMLALRADLSGSPTFRDLLAQARERTLGAYGAQEVPFELLVDALRIPRELNRHPVFQSVLIYHGAPGTAPEFAGMKTETLPGVPAGKSKFDLLLSVTEAGAGLQAELEYDTELFERETIERMAERYLVLLGGITEDSTTPVGELPLLTQAERVRVLEDWNRTGTEYPRKTPVSRLFEEQVDRAPDAVAIIAPRDGTEERTSYRALDARANRLANYLRRHGVAAGSTVGIVLDRSTEFVVAMLAALKAGAVYVPLDPSLPANRLATMLSDVDSACVVTSGRAAINLPRGVANTFHLDRLQADIARESEFRLTETPGGDAPAYVMYTSGSTGRPKGVSVPHRAIVRLVRNTDYVSLSRDETILACAPVSFDASTFELWGSLLNGGQLVLYPEEVPHPSRIGKLIATYRVTTLWLTAGLFHVMAETNPGAFVGLRQLLAGGDVLSPSLVRKVLGRMGSGVLINGYGPTENTTFTCCHRMTAAAGIGETVPIGKPIANTRVYVLDARMQPVPIGVRGELWAGGDGVALGYRNDPDLTAERFRADPFAGEPGSRLYRTGDVVRYRSDGVLEFMGRSDTQIKIRGFRIEPGEIERTLCLYPGVADAVAIPRERGPGNKVLLGYVVPMRGSTIDMGGLRSFLRQRLPEYAVPSGFTTLEAFPLTPNGKIDYAALPDPVVEHAPRSLLPDALQTQLLLIWEQVLGVAGVGIDDNFFDLGGNSLRAIAMLSSVEKALGRPVPVAALYRGQTVATMAQALRDESVDPSLRAIAIQPGGSRPVLFVVPGVGGDVVGYEALARTLGTDQPLYGLRSAGLDGEVAPIEDAVAIATSLLAEVQRIQPRGPYRLAGFCMGGIIAYEMAQQLAARGERTELLGLIDTWAPQGIRIKPRHSRYTAQLSFLLRGASRHLRAWWHQPRGKRLEYLLQNRWILGEMLKQRDIYRGDTHLLHHELVTRANHRAAARYRPVAYRGRVVLVLSSAVPRAPDRDARLSWEKLAQGGATVIRIPGKDSGSLLRVPYVSGLAEALAQQLAVAGGDPEPR